MYLFYFIYFTSSFGKILLSWKKSATIFVEKKDRIAKGPDISLSPIWQGFGPWHFLSYVSVL